jgi:transcriptional regulator with XRE-family HTH domain
MLGPRIRERRKALGLTQAQLAQIANIPQFHISSIETGRITVLKSDTIRRLARALRVTTDWVLEMEDRDESEMLTAAAS